MKFVKELMFVVIAGTLVSIFVLFPLLSHIDQVALKTSHENELHVRNDIFTNDTSSMEEEEEGEMWRCYYTLKCDN